MEKKKSKAPDTKKESLESVNRRLDALIRVILETLYEKKNKKFNETAAVQLLHSSGLTPTEISKILGKKGATAISPYLYDKKSKKQSKKTKESEMPDT